MTGIRKQLYFEFWHEKGGQEGVGIQKLIQKVNESDT
jgi:hypothetical protein